MRIEPLHKLNEVDKGCAVVFVCSPEDWKVEYAKHIYNAAQVLQQQYNDQAPDGTNEYNGSAFVKDAKQLVTFLKNYNKELNLTIFSSSKELALSLLITAYVVVEQLRPDYAIAAAALQDNNTQPAVWLLAVVDYYLELQGKLITQVEEYLVSGIAVTNTAQVIQATWDGF